MPKPAVTLLGLVLAAVAIGWNTWRYPVVWQMVRATSPDVSAGESAPAATDPAAKASPAKAAWPAAIASAKPVPEVSKDVIPDRAAATVETPLPLAMDAKPLRPISAIPSSDGNAAVLQRLPPVDPNEPPLSFDLRTAAGGTIVYPTTGY